jgi:hypothetical protein
MTVDAHHGAGVKIHYIEIDGLHDKYLSQREPFRQSAAASQRPTVGGDTLMVDGNTSTDGSVTSTVDAGTSMVDGCTLTVNGYIPMVGGNTWTVDNSTLTTDNSTHIDEDINTLTTIIPSIEILGPITRSRAQ